MPITRRRLAGFVAAIAAGLLVAPPSAIAQDAQEKILLKFATISAPNNWETRMLHVFAEYVNQAAPNQFEIQVLDSGTLLQQGGQVQALERGTIEMVPLGSSWIVESFPEYGLLNAGYLLRGADHLCSLWHSEVGEEIREKVSEELGFQVLAALYTGTRQVGLRQKREVRTPEDLAGLKMRMIGSKSYLFLGEALGANPTPMAFGEVYLALQTGAIDAQDNPLPTLYGAKFHEVLEQIVLTNHLVQDVLIGASNEFWEKLNDTQKEIISEAAWVAANFATQAALRDERTLRDRLAEAGLTITEPDVDAFRARVAAAYAEDERAQAWKPGLWETISNLETAPACVF
jgi:tripartite ATP-independent transporter DctP family solute receptor